jgi:hypothetical protein
MTSLCDVTGMIVFYINIGESESSANGRVITAVFRVVNSYTLARYIGDYHSP